MNSVHDWVYSYSGADAKAFVSFDGFGSGVRELTSMQTVSWNVFEAKGPARALGHRGVKGFARGVRTIAGSIIFTVIKDNPLRPLLDMLSEAKASGTFPYEPGWSVDKSLTTGVASSGGTGTYWGDPGLPRDILYQNIMASLIPPFNLSVVYSTEVLEKQNASKEGTYDVSAAAWRLTGVEFISEGLVTSTHDTITEVTCQFVATGMNPVSLNHIQVSGPYITDAIAGGLDQAENLSANTAHQTHMDIAARLAARSSPTRDLGTILNGRLTDLGLPS